VSRSNATGYLDFTALKCWWGSQS